MYCLILFYTVIQDSIKEFHPVLKLMAIKAIIAAAFWQSVIIGMKEEIVKRIVYRSA